ncbi:MAG: disulfide bond formation protein B [Pseudomonadota bacterium]
MTRRSANLLGFGACVGLMAYALYAQHGLGLEPCPLCVFQRIGVIATGVVFLIAALHNPAGGGRIGYALALLLTGGATAAVAGRHVWLQNLPPDQVPACGASLEFLLDTAPFFDVLQQVFTGSGECAAISWSFLGLSMPTWVLIAAAALTLAGVVANALLPTRSVTLDAAPA